MTLYSNWIESVKKPTRHGPAAESAFDFAVDTSQQKASLNQGFLSERQLPGAGGLSTARGTLEEHSAGASAVHLPFPRAPGNLIINLGMEQCQQHRVLNAPLLVFIACTM